MKYTITALFFLACISFTHAQTKDSSSLKIKLTGHTGDLECVAFSPNGKLLASSGWDNKINIYQADTPGFGRLLQTLTGHLAAVTSLNFSRDGRFLISAGKDYSIRIWNIDTPSNVKVYSNLHNEAVTNAFLDGKSLFSSSVEGTVRYTLTNDPKKGRVIKVGTPVNDIVLSTDRKYLYVASNSTAIRKYDLSGKELESLQGHIDYVNALDMSPNGKILASASNDKSIILWDLTTGKQIHKMQGHDWKVTSVKFSSDGKYLVSGCNDGTVKLWNTETGKLITTFHAMGTNVRDVAFSPNAAKIAVATYLKVSNNGALIYNSGVETAPPPTKQAPVKGTPKGQPVAPKGQPVAPKKP